ncbi:ProQ/FINO family protein [Photobacterium angustum]|uniref:ProQ/FINO family protein n=1 Tax=Photobacterium angustum TaxID=661 RepID=UPI0005DF9490|nr:ProQ/FINO family protein [Photobacterium angustum]KJG00102.1 hypothetical protein UB35_19820 [Photobacterium angustum]
MKAISTGSGSDPQKYVYELLKNKKLPFAVGSRDGIRAIVNAVEHGFSDREIEIAINAFFMSDLYLEAVITSNYRYRLNGWRKGKVAPADRLDAARAMAMPALSKPREDKTPRQRATAALKKYIRSSNNAPVIFYCDGKPRAVAEAGKSDMRVINNHGKKIDYLLRYAFDAACNRDSKKQLIIVIKDRTLFDAAEQLNVFRCVLQKPAQPEEVAKNV